MVCLKSHSFSMCIHVHTIVYIRNILVAFYRWLYLFYMHLVTLEEPAAYHCHLWSSHQCMWEFGSMAESLVVSWNSKSHGSPSTFNRPTQNCPLETIFFLMPPFDFQRNPIIFQTIDFQGPLEVSSLAYPVWIPNFYQWTKRWFKSFVFPPFLTPFWGGPAWSRV